MGAQELTRTEKTLIIDLSIRKTAMDRVGQMLS